MKLVIAAILVLALAIMNVAKAEGYENGYGSSKNLSADSLSESKSAAGSVAVSPNNVSIQQPNNSVTTVTNESASAYAPSVLMNSTAPCRVGVGGSGGWIAGSFGIGGSFEDKECAKREAFRLGIMAPDADIRAAAKAAYFNLEAIKVTGVTPLTLSAAKPEKMDEETEVSRKSYSPEELCIVDGGRMEESRYDGSLFCRRP